MIDPDQINVGDIIRTTEESIFRGSLVEVVNKYPGKRYPFFILDDDDTVPILLDEIEEIVFTI